MTQAEIPELVNRLEAAQILGVFTQNLYRLVDLPEPCQRVGNTSLWRKADIEAFAAKRAEAKD